VRRRSKALELSLKEGVLCLNSGSLETTRHGDNKVRKTEQRHKATRIADLN
jgi:hypothetical protein